MPQKAAIAYTPEPPLDCPLCPRLVDFLKQQRAVHPDWFNAPVPSFGTEDAELLIVGLAPGLQGANRTGRPFTGDYAGDLLYPTLIEFGWATGTFKADPNDGLKLQKAMITNAVRCVPPQNKPTGGEANNCRGYLEARLAALPKLKAILALGRIAHDNTLPALGFKRSAFTFGHNAAHDLGNGIRLFDSYHCSRYNLNTRRLTEDMFHDVFRSIAEYLGR
ncbi:uracil-DNA glycosylase [Tepidicaulis sp. LMO-SS28]|uniref:uracil-DNA glycosylase n=1 Tax=Tepidicaulis sp. LMO-SS28 TaxID=3447455 RepID=UPI003EE2657F